MARKKGRKNNFSKRSWGRIVQDIQLGCEILEKEIEIELWENAWQELWQELFDISQGNFYRLSRSFLVAKEYFQGGWQEIYIEEMFKKALKTEHWRFIAKHSVRNFPVYRIAVEKVYKDTKKLNTLYHWKEFKKTLDNWYPLMPEVEKRIMRFKKTMKKERK